MHIICVNHGDYLVKPCTLFINHAHYIYIMLIIYKSCSLFIYHARFLTQTALHSYVGLWLGNSPV